MLFGGLGRDVGPDSARVQNLGTGSKLASIYQNTPWWLFACRWKRSR
jgi:hypothetical protein